MTTEDDKYKEYMPPDDEAELSGQEVSEPIDVPGQEPKRDVVFKLDVQIPAKAYLKPIRGRVSSKFNIIMNVLLAIDICMMLALAIIAPPKHKTWWIVLLCLFTAYIIFMEIFIRNRRKKEYLKLVAARENEVVYTFYADGVNVKNPNIEGNLLYENAEYYAETKDFFVIVFQLSRNVIIEKSQCSEWQLEFLRNVVSEKNQKAIEKKALISGLIKMILMIAYIAMLSYSVVQIARIRKVMNSYEYTTEYEYTTYDSFIDCVGAGTIKDVAIYEDRFIEYTFFGRGYDERYYTSYDGDISVLTMILDSRYVNWKIVK